MIDFLGTATPHRAAWFPFFPAFTGGHDGDVRDHCVGVHQHRESPAGSTLARQLAWFFGRLQPGRRVAHTAGVLVCRLAALLWLVVLGLVVLRRNANLPAFL